VLLAPSWGDETILNRCGEPLCEALLEAGLRLTLRPHYHTRRLTPGVIDVLLRRFGDHPRFAYIDRMGEDESLFDSDVMITDWSGAGMDYALGLAKPVLYVDLPPKSRNDSWQSLGLEPFEAWIRTRIGALLPEAEIAAAPAAIRRLLAAPGEFAAGIAELREEWIYNLWQSAAAAADAIAELADRPPPDPAGDGAPGRG
jgi:YidC/Oxa1 family membrane protein insertase